MPRSAIEAVGGAARSRFGWLTLVAVSLQQLRWPGRFPPQLGWPLLAARLAAFGGAAGRRE